MHFREDVRAGITVSVLLIPQSMAYALLAGLPPIFGLYGALVPLIVYAIFGSSRQLSIGPVAISSLLILAGISTITEPFTRSYVEDVITLGLMVGVIQFLMGVLRFGFLVNFLSHPVISGFISAAAIIIVVSQLKDVTGISMSRGLNPVQSIIHAIKNFSHIHYLTTLIAALSFLILFISRRIKKSFPAALILIVIGIFLSYYFRWEDAGVAVIESVPHGLPPFYVPIHNSELMLLLMPTAMSVAIIGMVESIGIAKHLEQKHKDHILSPNQELRALGLSKIFGSFWQALPTSSSFSRSAINSDQGAKSQISNLVAVFMVILTLVFLTSTFYHLPKAILAAIILQAVINLFDFSGAKHLWQLHRWEFGMWFITFIITLLVGIEEGVAAGVILSILVVLFRSSKPHISIMGNVPGTTYYRNIERFEEAQDTDDMLILRFDAPLYFGNSNFFKERIRHFIQRKPTVKNVLIDASTITSIDSSAIMALRDLDDELQANDIHIHLCGTIGPVRDILMQEGLMSESKKHHMDVHSAVQFINENVQQPHQDKARQSNR